jgi:predicted RNA-binding protein YlxR (DUF448 family)
MLARIDHDLTDSGRGSAATERLCALTRKVVPVSELIRFVVGPDGAIVPDVKKALPGRGVWVTGTREALTEAIRRNAFAKSFKRDVRPNGDLVELTDRLLERGTLDALSIANKARLIVTGFAKIDAAISQEGVAALLHARDAGSDGVRKLDAALHRGGQSAAQVPVLSPFTGAQLDLALGRPNVVHAALLAGPETQRFIARAARLTRFRSGEPADPDMPVPSPARSSKEFE